MTANPTLQKVLAHPVRQGTMTTTAVPWQGCDRQRRFKGELIRSDPGWGTLMRHFLLPGSVTALAFGMGVTTAAAVGGPGRHSARCSSGGHDHSGCK